MSQSPPEYWEKAKRVLSRRDPIMRALIKEYKGEDMVSRGAAHYTLARSIVGQQISVKAAAAVWQRLEDTLKEVTPQALLNADVTVLRACGLSGRKVEYMKSLSLDFVERLEHYDWANASDEEVVQALISIRGIGRWTAEMFMIFHLMRPDILPLDDIGLQKGVEKLYNQGKKLPIPELQELAERWRPYRSVATWYLWRSLDPVTVVY